MAVETFTESYGRRGSTTTTVNGAGSVTVNNSTTPVQRAITSFRTNNRRHKPDGWLYPTSYTRTLSSRDNGQGTWQMKRFPPTTSPLFTNVQTEVGCIGNYSAYLNVGSLPPAQSALKNRAVIEALLKLKDQQVNLAQAYAERQMTADLLGSSLSRIARSLRLLRRRKLKEAWRELGGNPRKLPKTWLEYQYGWTPLLNDVHGSVTKLQQLKKLSDWVITVKGNVTDKSTSEEILTGSYSARRNIESMCGYFVRLDYTPDNGFLSTLSSLGLTNPALLAWELVPYSFVVDWAVPIGDWLSSLDASLGFQFLSGSATEKRQCLTRVRALIGIHPQDPLYKITRAEYECSRKELSLIRTPYVSSPLPGFPGFKDPLSLVHAANGLSLLSQALSGGPVKVR